MLNLNETRHTGIKDAWAELVRSRPRLHQREAADLLGISEAALVASRCGDGAVRLQPKWREILAELPKVGTVKTITRNAHAVHETIGRYGGVSLAGDVAIVQSPDLDLRMLLGAWASGYALSENVASGPRWSVQFFDRNGTSVHKVFLEPDADVGELMRIVGRFALSREDLATAERVDSAAASGNGATNAAAHRNGAGNGEATGSARRNEAGFGAVTGSAAGDASAAIGAALMQAWSELRDTHDFLPMLASHGVRRRQAMDIAEGGYTRNLGRDGLRRLLQALEGAGLPVMVFVSNPGCVQIRTQAVTSVRVIGPWLNILDPTFNLHVMEASIESTWVVEKPTSDGIVTALEVYAHDGSEVLVMYGARKPGKAESPAWRAAIESLFATGDAQ
ncbi:MAG TPA: ChuX/HutX family heme-like substrate-binding protein [Candidatus Binatia bacterium]|nr:ChuX/HutX family heme-like substrate-binding protein [Candidatus Binatia bacterium]